MRKHVVKSFKMFDQANISGNATSEITNVMNLDKASIHLEWSSASIDGEILVEARNGVDDSWYVLDFNTTLAVNTDNSFMQIVLNELPFTDIRLRYVSTAGSGTIDATLTMKTTGA